MLNKEPFQRTQLFDWITTGFLSVEAFYSGILDPRMGLRLVCLMQRMNIFCESQRLKDGEKNRDFSLLAESKVFFQFEFVGFEVHCRPTKNLKTTYKIPNLSAREEWLL